MATATNSKKVSPKRRRTKPGEVKARREKPAPITLPALEWIVTDRNGEVNRHTVPNPLVGIVNKFNEEWAKFGAVASLPTPEPVGGPYAVVFIPDLTGDQPENLIEVPGFGLQTLEMDEQSFAPGERLFFSTRGEAFTEAANLNATQTANPYYWNVVVEVGVGCAFLSVDLDSDGHGTFDAHALPYSIVKPTEEERAMYGQRKGGAA